MPRAAANELESFSHARRKNGRATVGSFSSRQMRPASTSTFTSPLSARRASSGVARSGRFARAASSASVNCWPTSPAGVGIGRSTGCQVGTMPAMPDPGGETRLNGSAITSGRWPGAAASNSHTPALNASSAHSPFALVRVANVFWPRKSPPAKPKIASTCTSASFTGSFAAVKTLPVSRSSGCAATAAPIANAAIAPQRSAPRACTALSRSRKAAAVNDGARPLAGVPPVVEDDAAVDDHGRDADGILERIGEGGAVGDRRRIENHEIGGEPVFDQTAVADVQLRRREAAHLVHRLLERDHMLFADVLAEHAGERPEAARVRHADPQRAARRERGPVGTDRDPGLLPSTLPIVLVAG